MQRLFGFIYLGEITRDVGIDPLYDFPSQPRNDTHINSNHIILVIKASHMNKSRSKFWEMANHHCHNLAPLFSHVLVFLALELEH